MHGVEVIVHVSIKLDKRECNLRDCSDGVGSGHPTVPSVFVFGRVFLFKKKLSVLCWVKMLPVQASGQRHIHTRARTTTTTTHVSITRRSSIGEKR